MISSKWRAVCRRLTVDQRPGTARRRFIKGVNVQLAILRPGFAVVVARINQMAESLRRVGFRGCDRAAPN
jgi:hypothetical protein